MMSEGMVLQMGSPQRILEEREHEEGRLLAYVKRLISLNGRQGYVEPNLFESCAPSAKSQVSETLWATLGWYLIYPRIQFIEKSDRFEDMLKLKIDRVIC